MTRKFANIRLAPATARHRLRQVPRARLARAAAKPKSGPWLVSERAAFLARLAATDAVEAAASAIGRTRSSALAERMRDAVFASDWDAILGPKLHLLETRLLDRTLDRFSPVVAVEGLTEAAIRHDAAIAMWLLQGGMPERYGKLAATAGPRPEGPGRSAVQNQVAALVEEAEQRLAEAEAALQVPPID